jgi:hypothetical protein
LLTKLAAPLADSFRRDDNPMSEPELLRIQAPEAEAEIQPDTMAAHLVRESVVLVAVDKEWAHATSIVHQARSAQAAQ